MAGGIWRVLLLAAVAIVLWRGSEGQDYDILPSSVADYDYSTDIISDTETQPVTTSSYYTSSSSNVISSTNAISTSTTASVSASVTPSSTVVHDDQNTNPMAAVGIAAVLLVGSFVALMLIILIVTYFCVLFWWKGFPVLKRKWRKRKSRIRDNANDDQFVYEGFSKPDELILDEDSFDGRQFELKPAQQTSSATKPTVVTTNLGGGGDIAYNDTEVSSIGDSSEDSNKDITDEQWEVQAVKQAYNKQLLQTKKESVYDNLEEPDGDDEEPLEEVHANEEPSEESDAVEVVADVPIAAAPPKAPEQWSGTHTTEGPTGVTVSFMPPPDDGQDSRPPSILLAVATGHAQPPKAKTSPVMPHDSPVIPHDSPVMPHDSPVMPHDSPVIPHDSPVMPHDSPVMPHDSPVMPHDSPVMPHDSPVMPHDSPVMPHDSPVMPHDSPVMPHDLPPVIEEKETVIGGDSHSTGDEESQEEEEEEPGQDVMKQEGGVRDSMGSDAFANIEESMKELQLSIENLQQN